MHADRVGATTPPLYQEQLISPETPLAHDGFDTPSPSAAQLHELLDDLRDRLGRTDAWALPPREILTIEQLRWLQTADGAEVLRALHSITRARHDEAKARHRWLEGLTQQAHRYSLREADVLAYIDSVLARLVQPGARPAGSKLHMAQ